MQAVRNKRETLYSDLLEAVPDTPEVTMKDYRSPKSVDVAIMDIADDSPALERVWPCSSSS